MAGRNNWTREQTMMAFALYRILPSGKWDKRNPTVQRLADHIRRSPSAVALKLGNLASLDENRTTKGLTNCSRLDREIWEEYAERGDALVFESSQLLATAIPSWSRSSRRRSGTTVRPWSRNASTSSISATRSYTTTTTAAASRESRSTRYW